MTLIKQIRTEKVLDLMVYVQNRDHKTAIVKTAITK